MRIVCRFFTEMFCKKRAKVRRCRGKGFAKRFFHQLSPRGVAVGEIIPNLNYLNYLKSQLSKTIFDESIDGIYIYI